MSSYLRSPDLFNVINDGHTLVLSGTFDSASLHIEVFFPIMI